MNFNFNLPFLKSFTMLLILLGVGTRAFAQVNQEDDSFGTPTDTTQYVTSFNPKETPPDCKYPSVTTVNVVNYATRSVAKLALNANGLSTANLTFTRKGDISSPAPLYVMEGSATISNLAPNTVYEVKGYNSCGAPVVIAEFNTYPYRPGKDGIKVSDKLYRHISVYLLNKETARPLHEYISSLQDIDDVEKSAFLQQFFMKGGILPDNQVGLIPTDIIRNYLAGGDPTPGEGNDDDKPCLCEFVLNQSAYVIPDAVGGNHSIERVVENQNGNWSTSRWWLETREGGPAKMQKLASDGWKENLSARNSRLFERGVSTNSQQPKSPNYATIAYTFLCVNYPAATPTECGCDKTIRVRGEYTSRADIRATIRSGGGGNKESWARAQDFSVMLVTRTNANGTGDVQVLDAGSLIATGKCSGGVATSQLLKSAASIVGSVAGAVVAVKTGNIGEIGAATADLITKTAEVFELFEKPVDCNSDFKEEALVQKTSSIVLKPNDPVSVVILSGSALETGGRRSWDSYAKINSDFFLTGVLLGSNSAPGETHCCTDYSAQWAYATENRVVSSLTIPVNAHIFGAMNGAGTISINGVPASSNNTNYSTGSEIGNANANFQGCEAKVPVFNFIR